MKHCRQQNKNFKKTSWGNTKNKIVQKTGTKFGENQNVLKAYI